MKKPISLTDRAAIWAELKRVNGQAGTHVYYSPDQLAEVCAAAEKQLSAWGLPKKFWRGVRVTSCSITKLPNSYDWRVTGTEVTLVRRSRDWCLKNARKIHDWPKNFRDRLQLTPQQDAEIVQRVRAQYDLVSTGGEADSERTPAALKPFPQEALRCAR